MRRFTSRLGALAATALLALTGTSTAQADGHTEAAYFNLRDVTHSNFIIKLTDPDKIREAREIIASGERKIVIGRIETRRAPYNPRWNYHYQSDTVGFTDAAIEVCDATIPYVEDHLDEVGGAFLPGRVWCPWSGHLTEEVNP